MRAFPSCSRSDSKNGEVAGAAAEIADEDEFVVIEHAFIEESSCDGFVFENHGTDSRLCESAGQPVECELIVLFRFCIGKPNGAPDCDWSVESADLLFRLNSYLAKHDRNKIFERKLLPVYAGTREKLAGEKRLQGLNEPSFLVRRQITFDRDRPSDA